MINDHYKSMIHEYQSLNKIIERIFKIYYFLKMRKQIEDIIRKCNVCIHTKHNQHKLYELLKSLNILNHVWKSIALNFIVKLFKSKKRVIKTTYNFILIIINKLIKYKYFLSYKKVTFTKDLTYTFLRIIVANYELSDEIISDRDKFFTLNFGKFLMNQLKIHHKLSINWSSSWVLISIFWLNLNTRFQHSDSIWYWS